MHNHFQYTPTVVVCRTTGTAMNTPSVAVVQDHSLSSDAFLPTKITNDVATCSAVYTVVVSAMQLKHWALILDMLILDMLHTFAYWKGSTNR